MRIRIVRVRNYFRSMKITQDIREEVAAMVERDKGMAEKSAEFLEKGGKLYV